MSDTTQTPDTQEGGVQDIDGDTIIELRYGAKKYSINAAAIRALSEALESEFPIKGKGLRPLVEFSDFSKINREDFVRTLTSKLAMQVFLPLKDKHIKADVQQPEIMSLAEALYDDLDKAFKDASCKKRSGMMKLKPDLVKFCSNVCTSIKKRLGFSVDTDSKASLLTDSKTSLSQSSRITHQKIVRHIGEIEKVGGVEGFTAALMKASRSIQMEANGETPEVSQQGM